MSEEASELRSKEVCVPENTGTDAEELDVTKVLTPYFPVINKNKRTYGTRVRQFITPGERTIYFH